MTTEKRVKLEIEAIDGVSQQLSKKIKDYLLSDYKKLADEFELVRESKRRNRKIFKYDSGSKVYYIKVLRSKRFAKLLENLFIPEGFRYFKLSKQLLELDIPVVKPIMAVKVKKSLLRNDAVFVTEEFKAKNLREYLKQDKLSEIDLALRIKIMKSLARIWAKLINHNFLHQDPTPANFLLKLEQRDFELSLVDVDDIYCLPWQPKRMAIHSLARFCSKFFSHLVRTGNEVLLTRKERFFFFKELYQNYQTQVDFKDFVREINQLTIKKLLKRGHRDLIKQSKIMKEFL